MTESVKRKADGRSSMEDELPSKKSRRVLFYDCFLDSNGDKVIREVTREEFLELDHPYFAPPILGYSPISKVYVEKYKKKGGKKSDCIFKIMKELRAMRKSNLCLKEKYDSITKQRMENRI
jgi:hypothetical protein